MKRFLVCVVAVTLAVSPAFAQSPNGGITIDPSQLGRQPHAAPAVARVAPRTPRMPAVLAASSEPARRAEMEKLYAQLLAAFEQMMDKGGLGRNDVAVAAAMYVAGTYGAYRGIEVSDAAFKALVTQLRDGLAAIPAFANAPMAQKQDMYEAFAITGTLMAASARAKPADANVRTLAKTYLESFLGRNVDRIEITDRGIGLAGAAAKSDARTPAPTPTSTVPVPSGPAFPSAKVEALLWTTELKYQAFPANSMVMNEDDYLLLTDGTCTDRVPKTLDGFDPVASRAAHPKRWCTWRKRGSSYEVAFNGSTRRLPGLTVLRGARRGERLAGTWTRNKTGTVGTASTWNGTTFVLGADGRFEIYKAHAYSSNTNVNRPEGEVVVSGVGDDRGGRATISGKNVGGSVRTRSGNTAADRSGTYVLDGLTIELRYDSGKVERQMFAMSSDPNHVFVRLGSDMLPKKK